MARWSVDSVPSLAGRTALVTGANSGIGLEAARMLAQRGATVVLGCRDTTKGERAAADIRASARGGVEVLELDLADLTRIEVAAETFCAGRDRLDILVNNAGVMALPYRATVDGFEMQLGTNHLGHFALTGHLLPRLLAAPAPRVVTVSSVAHRMGRIDFDNLDASRGYSRWPAYGQSKLANLLFAFELQRRADAAGCPLTSAAAHPGYTATNLQKTGPAMSGNRLGVLASWVGNRLVGQSARAGAWPTVYAAAMPDVARGDYLGPRGLAQLWGRPRKVGAAAAARDPEVAARLWLVSEQLTGVRYEALSVD